MLTAAKSAWFEAVFRRYNERWLIRRAFHSFALRGDLDEAGPALYVMNHSSWWDGLLVYHAVKRASALDHYMMMDENQLRRFAFFRRIGAFSIDKSSPKGVLASLDYAAAQLQAGRSVWLFPQGDIHHADERPLRMQSGVGHVLRLCGDGAPVIPVTMAYRLCMHQKTEASLWVGEAVRETWTSMNRREAAALIGERLTSQLDAHRDAVIRYAREEELPGFTVPLLGPGRSISDAYAAAKGAKVWRYFSKS